MSAQILSTKLYMPPPVNKHVGIIFDKLGVTNRTEAVARARALQLLD